VRAVGADGGRDPGLWLIIAAIAGLVVWAVVDFIDPGGRQPIRPVTTSAAAEQRLPLDLLEPTALYRLLPDATRDVGRVVEVDGTVVGPADAGGFWIRDMRDHVVFIALGEQAAALMPTPGATLKVTGIIEDFPLHEQAVRYAELEGHLSDGVLVIRDIKVVPVAGGIRTSGT